MNTYYKYQDRYYRLIVRGKTYNSYVEVDETGKVINDELVVSSQIHTKGKRVTLNDNQQKMF